MSLKESDNKTNEQLFVFPYYSGHLISFYFFICKFYLISFVYIYNSINKKIKERKTNEK